MTGSALAQEPRPGDASERPRSGGRLRPWHGALAVITVIFLVFALPPYLGLDPGQSRVTAPTERHPLFYPVLVAHIFAGGILLICGVLQLWPWLRRRHRNVHRWSGRLYVLMAIPVGLGGLFIAQFPSAGPNQQIANSLLALLILGTTLAGYRAARRRRFGDHRAWMLRSFALAFSIITNRVWGLIFFVIFVPQGGGTLDDQLVQDALSPSAWANWVVNLLIVEWWILRRQRRRT